MNDRRSCHHHHHHHSPQRQQDVQQTFEERCRILENELKQKNDIIDRLRNEMFHYNQQNDQLHAQSIPTEKPVARSLSQRSNNSLTNKLLMKDREIAKLKTLIFQKDNELIALSSANKNTVSQMGEQLERELKVWNEHKDLLLAGERMKFEEEKTRSLKDLHDQLKLEQDRCQRLEQKLQDTQRTSNEAQLMLKDSGRERINAVYGIKEQCRKEFQDEITRLRNQFQMEKDAECARIQDRIRELEDALDRATNENADAGLRQHELFLNLETSDKNWIRTINDCIKKLLMAMDSPSKVYAKIPHITSFKYDQKSIAERLPIQNSLKLLQDTVNDIQNYILEQRVQTETKGKLLNKSNLLTDRTIDYTNRKLNIDINNSQKPYQQYIKNSSLKDQKENEHYFNDIGRLSQPHDRDHYHSQTNLHHPFHLSSEQNDTINNLVQKLEDHIASELNRLTKQRLTLNGLKAHDEQPTSYPLEAAKMMKFEPNTVNTNGGERQDTLIRHLQGRISDLQDHNIRLRNNDQSKIYLSTNSNPIYDDNDNHQSLSSMFLSNCSTT